MKLRSFGTLTCAALLWSGQLKQIPPFNRLTVDLTLVLLLLSLGIGGAHLVLSKKMPPVRNVQACAILAVMVIAGAVNSPLGLYSELKVQRLMFLTMAMVIAVAINVRSNRDYFRFLGALVGVAGYVSLSTPFAGTVTAAGRLTAASGATISFGRAAGLVIIAVVAWWLTTDEPGFKRIAGALTVIGFELYILVSIGSRGPVQAVVLAVLAMVALQSSNLRPALILRILLQAIAVSLVAVVAWSRAPEFARTRVGGLLTGQAGGRVGGGRNEYYRWTLEHLPFTPLGNGWGTWRSLSPFDRFNVNYVHNVFLEVWFEAGLVGFACLCFLIARALRTHVRHIKIHRFRSTVAVGAVVYWIAVAIVSGDVNDNRALFAVLSVSSLALAHKAASDATPELGVTALFPSMASAVRQSVDRPTPVAVQDRTSPAATDSEEAVSELRLFAQTPLFPNSETAPPSQPLFPARTIQAKVQPKR